MNMINRIVVMGCLLILATLSIPAQAVTQLVDPTRPANYHGSPTNNNLLRQGKGVVEVDDLNPVLTLQAIRIGQHSRLAVINGQTVKPGGMVSTATLISIEPDAVFLEYEGQSIKLMLLPSSVKKRSIK